ncbi:MAG: aspartyl/glutamyl-tRNA amidotransferase subunit B [Betaproteobacteria bacterium RIFCSPLOWO2_02_FULL_67_26]|nr:MAG: aspartyl/glutamyl-tRNA amidotransferase subunit B [Betaproteobacteria bacterium RIFCSPLOWO2_02_FULL_67_26]
MKWEVVIGLETHAQLSTKSKMFSGASTAFGAAPNTQACAVDIALPGVLPVANKAAVECAIRFGLAVGGADGLSRRSVFARKNYFYPDLPKGYQISQYELPIVKSGEIPIVSPTRGEIKIRLTRAHLEEDAGKSLHEGFHDFTGIDLNRAGTPLLEIVSEPDMCSADEAVSYARALHALVRWIDICDGNMQEGSFRCDANVSVRRPGEPLGTRREIKNLNSFRFLQQAIEFEAKWQIETLESGGKIEQATVLFDPDTGETRAMRSKEDAHDYRYFPDPDLLPLVISEEWIAKIAESVVAVGTPQVRKNEYIGSYGLSSQDAWQLVKSRETADYFDKVMARLGKHEAKLCANWMNGELASVLNRDSLDITQSRVSSAQLADLLARVRDGTLSNKMAKEVFDAVWAGEGDPDAIIEKRGLKQISDSGELEKFCDQVIAANAKQVEDYRAGKDKAFNSLVGQAMKLSKGKANPQQVSEILKRKLAS